MLNSDINNIEEKKFTIDLEDRNLSSILIGKLLKKGNKSKACTIYFKILKLLKNSSIKKVPVELIMECLTVIKPSLKLKSKKVGGMVYQIPVPLKKKKEYSIGIKWLVENSNNKNNAITLEVCKDVLQSIKYEGDLIKKKENDYKLAIVNRPFLKFLK